MAKEAEVIADMEPFVVETSGLFDKRELDMLICALKKVSGVKYLSLRNICRGAKSGAQRFMISAVGTLKQRNSIKYHLSGSRYRTIPFFNSTAAFTINNFADTDLILHLAKDC
uniref:F-box domain-containing protein n=1 Tax=Rhabditophanes sp. KR3021 TaxID=114890 RepID=A0AC35UER6_9BILA